jgi:hypothetical protein
MLEINYRKELELRLKNKKRQLSLLLEERQEAISTGRDWWEVQSLINSVSVDIDTIKGRIDNIGKTGTTMLDSNSKTISNLINK